MSAPMIRSNGLSGAYIHTSITSDSQRNKYRTPKCQTFTKRPFRASGWQVSNYFCWLCGQGVPELFHQLPGKKRLPDESTYLRHSDGCTRHLLVVSAGQDNFGLGPRRQVLGN